MAIPDLLSDIPRGVEDDNGEVRLDEQTLPLAVFMRPEAAAATRSLRFDGRRVFLGVAGGAVERRLQQEGHTEPHIQGGTAIGIANDMHMLTVAGSRAGKGRSAIVPTLLTYAGSVLAIDPKRSDHVVHTTEALNKQATITPVVRQPLPNSLLMSREHSSAPVEDDSVSVWATSRLIRSAQMHVYGATLYADYVAWRATDKAVRWDSFRSRLQELGYIGTMTSAGRIRFIGVGLSGENKFSQMIDGPMG